MKTAMILVAFCFAVSASAATQYELTDMGNIGNGHIRITGINNTGAVVGYVEHPSTTDAFLWQNGSFSILPGFGGVSPDTASAYGINENGDVVGTARKRMWVPQENQYLDINRSVLWHNGIVTDLDVQFPNTQSPFDISSMAMKINDNNQIVGRATTGSQGYSWEFGTCSVISGDLSPGNGWPEPKAVNNSGLIVGKSLFPTGNMGETYPRAFRTTESGFELLEGLGISEAVDVNDLGQIVGSAGGPNGNSNGFFWENGLGTIFLGSRFRAINNLGQACGNGDNGAILLDSGQIFNLHDLLTEPTDMALYEANAINDLGWIAGIGEMPNGDHHAWLLKPVPEPTALVPLALMLLFRKR